jgi:hypothetical protein
MASDPSRHRVVPQSGDDCKNGEERVAPANRTRVPAHSTGRRAPPGASKDGQPLGAGGYAALRPHLGWPPTLPRPRNPGPAGNSVRIILGRLARAPRLTARHHCCPWPRPARSSTTNRSSRARPRRGTSATVWTCAPPACTALRTISGSPGVPTVDLSAGSEQGHRPAQKLSPRPGSSDPRSLQLLFRPCC